MTQRGGDPRRQHADPRRGACCGRRFSAPDAGKDPASPAGEPASMPDAGTAAEEHDLVEVAEAESCGGVCEDLVEEELEAPPAEGGGASVRDALRDQVLRLQAEFDNYRKRQARDFHRLCAQGKRDLITELLVVLDNVDRAREHFDAGSQPSEILPGLFQTAGQMTAILGKEGLEAIELEPMMPFDPHLHEAVVAEDLPGATQDVVLEVFRRGYTFEKEILRPALVKVGRAPHQDESDAQQAEDGQAPPQEG